MDIFSLSNLVVTVGVMAWYYGSRIFGKKKKKKSHLALPAPKKNVSSHRLLKTYVAKSDEWVDGWRFLCSCGAKGTASNTKAATYTATGSLGSEASAIDKFKIHRDKYLEVNGDTSEEHEDTVKLRKLEAEFAEWRKACYCKDTNDDLLLLKHRHLDK